ncbi:NKG2-A/NKG2-B type II integral membrane protein-like isoform X3 [Sphaerodactylus townsendi]|uniref:NKG2-A/NKG2-B type II integral membrane protein-like isoform X3 n=1 Tax=Sphaerodactylus townsendi TaxID=933632 RepID=UPI002027553B|nr:NKG2-A/NKG2-B type II integral membrane protein-like isoform X3 [Sphaerodactylus townsendi]
MGTKNKGCFTARMLMERSPSNPLWDATHGTGADGTGEVGLGSDSNGGSEAGRCRGRVLPGRVALPKVVAMETGRPLPSPGPPSPATPVPVIKLEYSCCPIKAGAMQSQPGGGGCNRAPSGALAMGPSMPSAGKDSNSDSHSHDTHMVQVSPTAAPGLSLQPTAKAMPNGFGPPVLNTASSTDSASPCLQDDSDEKRAKPSGEEKAKHRSCRSPHRCPSLKAGILLVVAISLLSSIFLTTRIFVCRPSEQEAQQRSSNVNVCDVDVLCGPACPSGWIGYEGKCYFFSYGAKNWTSSQSFCSSYHSTLAVIENEQEKIFIKRYECFTDHWIGLQKDTDQTWKWADGTELNITLEVKGGGGDCAFLNSDSAISSRCHIQRNWICSHHDAYTRNKSSSRR